ncbi:MAG TPA: glycosyltransferase [Magnetospirillaceae bacterium]|jgi:hypothetical protein
MWRNRSILLCRAEATKAGNVDRIGREILDGFRANGWMAVDHIIDTANLREAKPQIIERIASGEFDLMLSVQDMGAIDGVTASGLLTQGGTRRLYWALDHPYSAWTSVAKLPTNAIVTYPTRSNVACCRNYLRSDITPLCVPHATVRQTCKPWSERHTKVFFVGNAPKESPEQIRKSWPSRYPPLWAGVLETMAALFEINTTPTLEGLAEGALREKGRNPNTIKKSDFMLLLATFDAYAWGVVRHTYMDAFRDLPLTVVGQGWDAFAGKSMRVLGPMETGASRALMAESKLILNLQSPWFRSHERIYEGMAAGCAVAAVGTGVFANVSTVADDPADRTAIAYLGAPEEAAAKVSALLGDDAALETLADAGWTEQQARHGWDNRVKTLLDAVEQAP